MPSLPPFSDTCWDFAPVRDLIDNLTPRGGHDNAFLLNPETSVITSEQSTNETDKADETAPSLGDFTNIWRYLNVPHDTPPPAVPPLDPTYEDTSEASGNSSSEAREDATASELSGLSKTQRKRQRRKLRKAETEASLNIIKEEQEPADKEVSAVEHATKGEALHVAVKGLEPVSPCPPTRIGIKSKSKSTLAALSNGPIQATSPGKYLSLWF